MSKKQVQVKLTLDINDLRKLKVAAAMSDLSLTEMTRIVILKGLQGYPKVQEEV